MRRYHELATQFYAAVVANKQISRLSFTSEELAQWLGTIEVINGFEPEQVMFGDYQISQFIIPQNMQALIHPERVSYSGKRRDTDLLERFKRPESNEVEFISEDGKKKKIPLYITNASEFNDMSRLIAGALKVSTVGISRPGEQTLASIENRVAVDDLIYSTAVPFIPLPVKGEFAGLFGQRHMIPIAEEHLVFSFGELISGRANVQSHSSHKQPANDFKANDLNPNNPE